MAKMVELNSCMKFGFPEAGWWWYTSLNPALRGQRQGGLSV